MSTLTYLYGFVAAGTPDPPPPPALEGVAGGRIRLHDTRGRIAAVVSDVPRDDYDAGAIEARMEDLEWIAAQGLAHERVVSWFVDHGDIVPVPLFTLYSGDTALDADVRARATTIVQALQRLGGRREWDLKLVCDAAQLGAAIAAASPGVRALDAEIAQAGPGRGFLLQRKRDELARDEVRHIAAERADALFAALAAYASDTVRLAIARTTEALPVVLHASLLVERRQEDALTLALEKELRPLRELGFSASLSGPWAPYRFLGAAAEADGAPAPESRA